MKLKLLVFFICFFSASFVFAQSWFIGGSAAFNISNSEYTSDETNYYVDSIMINISPILGYKFNKVDIGIYPIFQFRRGENNNNNVSNTQYENFGIGTGLFSRYNFISFKKFSILGSLSLEYLYTNLNDSYSSPQNIDINYKSYIHRTSFRLIPVIEYSLSKHFSLYSDLGILGIGGTYIHDSNSSSHSDVSNNVHQKRNSFSFDFPSVFNINLTQISLGFFVHF